MSELAAAKIDFFLSGEAAAAAAFEAAPMSGQPASAAVAAASISAKSRVEGGCSHDPLSAPSVPRATPSSLARRTATCAAAALAAAAREGLATHAAAAVMAARRALPCAGERAEQPTLADERFVEAGVHWPPLTRERRRAGFWSGGT